MSEKGFLNNSQVEKMTEFFSGKEFVEAVAKAESKERLKSILNANGIDGFTDEMLEECFVYLALSQDTDAMGEIFSETDYEICKEKLAKHGIEITKEDFDLVRDIIEMGKDPDYIRKLMKIETTKELLEELHKEGYNAVTEEFLDLLRENAISLIEDGILTPEELKGTEHGPIWQKYFKVINTLVAMTAITELVFMIPGATSPAFIIAVACGICLM